MIDQQPQEHVEKSGERHSVVREIVASRRKVVIEDDAVEFDLGMPTDAEAMQKIESLSTECAEEFMKESVEAVHTSNETLLTSLADFINKKFSFLNQGTGISTTKKLLEHYLTFQEKLHEDPNNKELQLEFEDGLDCKLATIMMGLTTEKVMKSTERQTKVQLMTKSNGAHPSLVISFSNGLQDQETFLVDAHNVLPKMDVKMKSLSIQERVRWEKEHGKSVITVRLLDDTGEKALERGAIHLAPITLEELRRLDQLFIDS